MLSRSQDDAMVGYVFQRPHSDQDFALPPAFKQQSRWPLADDSIIDHVSLRITSLNIVIFISSLSLT